MNAKLAKQKTIKAEMKAVRNAISSAVNKSESECLLYVAVSKETKEYFELLGYIVKTQTFVNSAGEEDFVIGRTFVYWGSKAAEVSLNDSGKTLDRYSNILAAMMFVGLAIAAAHFLTGCVKTKEDTADPACTGNSGSTYSCSSGYCSKSGGSGCSAPKDGVYCCSASGGGSGGSDGTNKCALGYCWTRENICCPRSAPYPCKGSCYSSNVCNYTSLTTACHDW